ncbi:hypothetical protein GCM10017784_19950 [Deinococcus indicus]|nr:hypothetical protein GCM10017784_19950 [Deinococcus indicus]
MKQAPQASPATGTVSYGLRLKGLQSPLGSSGCDSESCPAENEGNAHPDVETAGAVKFRMVSETNGSPYHSVRL